MSENVGASRLASYKNFSKNSQEMRQRRHDVTVELRKNKKDEQLFKRRNIHDIELPTSPLQEKNGQSSPALMTLDEIVQGINSTDIKVQYRATQSARKILSREKDPPIDIIIGSGIVPICVKFLDYFDHPDLQFEAAWTLTNLASGTSDQTKTVIEAGAIPKLINLLESPVANVADQAVWALGNIAGDGAEPRDLVLRHGAVEKLIPLLSSELPQQFASNTIWLMSNLCRNKNPRPPFDKIKPMLPLFGRYLLHPDDNIVSDVAWGLSYISDDTDEKIQAVIETGMLPQLVSLLNRTNPVVITPVLRTVGNIVTGNDQQTDAVIAAGAIEPLKNLLQYSKLNIVKEAAWTISNIAAGNRDQIQVLIASGVYQIIIEILKCGEFRCQREAAWTITNTTTGGSVEQIAYLIELGFLRPFCDILDVKDAKTIKVVLTGLANLFKVFEQANSVENLCMMIEECEGLDKLEKLQEHENEEVYSKAYEIIETYFAGENDLEEKLAPAEQNGELAFGTNTNDVSTNFQF